MTADSTVGAGRPRGLSDTLRARAFAEGTIDYQRILRTLAERMARLVGHGERELAEPLERTRHRPRCLYLSGTPRRRLRSTACSIPPSRWLHEPVIPDVLLERVRDIGSPTTLRG